MGSLVGLKKSVTSGTGQKTESAERTNERADVADFRLYILSKRMQRKPTRVVAAGMSYQMMKWLRSGQTSTIPYIQFSRRISSDVTLAA